MTDAVAHLGPPALTGFVFGLLYFGALWLTVRRALRSDRAAVVLLGSATARIAILLIGFYAVMDGTWERLVACLLGFVAARFGTFMVARSMGSTVRADV